MQAEALQTPEYPPIGDYALIGDTRTAALVCKAGNIEWLCLPDFDSGAVFARILDRLNGGHLSIAPTQDARTSRRYLDHTAILETRFEVADGSFRVTDLMDLAPSGTDGTVQPERELIRIVEVLEGEPEIAFTFEPRLDYGGKAVKLRERGKLGWTLQKGADFYLLRTDFTAARQGIATVGGTERLQKGERRHVSFSFCRRDIGVIPGLGSECEEKLAANRAWWSDWAGRCRSSGPFADQLVRSLVTLRQLTFSQSGAVIAAPTTSLPEAIGGTRNWDYRYCWLRDSYFILDGFIEAGYPAEAQAYFDWLMHATQLTAPELRVLYDIYGGTDLPERELDTLEGYARSAPVRDGNGAADQLQLDVYGSVVRAALAFVRGGGSFGRSEAKRLRGFGDVVRRQWTCPDNGIWEIRGGRLHHTYSKAMCWAALDGILQLQRESMVDCDVAALESERDAIRMAVESHGWNEKRGAFVGAFGEEWLDASVILLAKTGFIDPADPRMTATFERIEEELAKGPFVWRYRHGVDGFDSREGAFLACSFWMCEYLALRGDVAAAEARMQALLPAGNELGLFAEEYMPADDGSSGGNGNGSGGRMLGNFPQAFSHAALVSAALAIERARGAKERDLA